MLNKFKFIVGPPPKYAHNRENSIDELNSIFNKYRENISGCYIHPPFGGVYNERKDLDSDYTPQNIDYIKQQLQLIKQYNFKVQVTFNTWTMSRHFNSDQICDGIYKYIDIFGKPDYILTFDQFASDISKKFPEIQLVRTLNENNFITNIDDDILSLYDIIVFRNNLTNIELFKQLKEKYNTKIEVLLARNCISHCSFGCINCDKMFKTLVDTNGLNYELAVHAITPVELKLLEPYIDYVKVPPGNINTINNYMTTYLSAKDNYTVIKEYFDNWYNKPLNNFGRRQIIDNANYSFNKYTYKEIIKIKNQLWTEKLGYSVDLEKI